MLRDLEILLASSGLLTASSRWLHFYPYATSHSLPTFEWHAIAWSVIAIIHGFLGHCLWSQKAAAPDPQMLPSASCHLGQQPWHPWFTASQAPGFQRPLPPFLTIAHSRGKILTLCLPRVPENLNFNVSDKPLQALIPATFNHSQLLSTICSGSFFHSLSPCHELGSQTPSMRSPFLLFSMSTPWTSH